MNISLHIYEIFLVLSLIALICCEFVFAIRSRFWVVLYRPTLFVAVILIYYVLAGPLTALLGEGVVYKGLDHRALLVSGWLAAFLFYTSLLFGFYFTPLIHRNKILIRSNVDDDHAVHHSRYHFELLHRYGLFLCLLGFFLFILVGGTRSLLLLNPLAAGQLLDSGLGQPGLDVGPFTNYFNYSINLLIPGICLMSAAWYRQRRHTATILIWISITLALFISMGFRYRLVLLLIPVFLLWFCSQSRRPSFRVLSLFLACFVSINGLIGLSRSYGRGLDFSMSENLQLSQILNSALYDSVVFYTTSGVIDLVSKQSLFVGTTPIVNSLLFPIPRSLFPNKGDHSYQSEITAKLYGGPKFAAGSAILNYGEYFLMAGWPAVIVFSIILGSVLRFLWNWFLLRQNDPFAQVIYVVSVSYLYVVISRGYMPQAVMLFLFTVAPLYCIYGYWTKYVYLDSGASPPPITRS